MYLLCKFVNQEKEKKGHFLFLKRLSCLQYVGFLSPAKLGPPKKAVFGTNTMILGTNTIILATNTVILGTNTVIMAINMVIWGTYMVK